MESAKKIIDALKKRGYSIYKISKESGMSKTTIQRWDKGLCTPDPDKLLKLERFYKKVTDNKILSLEEAEAAGLEYYQYYNGTYEYKTEDGFYHLIIKGVDVLEGLGATSCCYYGNGFYAYKTANGVYHLIIDGVDVLEGLDAILCHYHGNGVYNYQTADSFYHLVINGVDVLEGLRATHCFYGGNGVYGYKTADGFCHLIINGVDVLEGLQATYCKYYGHGRYGGICYQTADNKWHEINVKKRIKHRK